MPKPSSRWRSTRAGHTVPRACGVRECGADGDLPGFRNWHNPAHVDELARLWNVETDTIPHWAPPTDAMQIFDYAEAGSVKWLWVSATNPAVSMPESARIRRILASDSLFLIVQDLFLTETATLADVVLPAAGWGEKTGTFTNVNRTVHLSEQAVPPPGDAKSDLDIFLLYARRMGFTDRDGAPYRPGTTRKGRSTPGGRPAAAGPSTTPGSPTRSCAEAAASPGRSPTKRRTAPTGSTPTASSRPTPRCARRTATTS